MGQDLYSRYGLMLKSWAYTVATVVHNIMLNFCLGAQIIDLMLLVVDITKGIQTQTAEVVCELTLCIYCMQL